MEPKKIMVVEDENIVAMELRSRLESLGYSVPAVISSGAEAIKKASESNPDLVLMDIVIKGDMDGIETAEQIRSNFNIPVVFVTAYADNITLQRAKITEPSGYILKPFKEKELQISIEIALYKHKIERELKESKEDLAKAVEKLQEAEKELIRHRDYLEEKVNERTADLNKSLQEKELLLKEIHHRVKNNMQIISSMLSLQIENIKEKKIIDMFIESQNRISSMALVHEKLYKSSDFRNIDFKEHIYDLGKNLFRSLNNNSKDIKFNINAEKILMDIDHVIPAGLIINELVTNSLKYAFPDSMNGEINISFISTNENMFELVVRDNGIGFPKDLDFRKTRSLGLHLVTILAENQLHGTIDLDRSKGTEFQIKFKLKNRSI